jgi:hypothetical protein
MKKDYFTEFVKALCKSASEKIGRREDQIYLSRSP